MTKIELLPHQLEALRSEKEFTGLITGFGAGKTECACHIAIYQIIKHKQLSNKNIFLITEPTNNMLHDILEPKMKEILRKWDFVENVDYSFNATFKEYNIFGIGKIRLRSGENMDRLVGAEYIGAVMDEVATIRGYDVQRELIERVTQRVRVSGSTQQKWIMTTPEPNTYVKTFFIDLNSPNKKLIRAKSSDNPYLPETYINSLKETHDDEILKAYLEGYFTNYKNNLVYYQFNRERNVVGEEFLINPYLQKIFVSFDFNVSPMTFVVIVQQDDAYVVVDEYYQNNSNTREAITFFCEKYLKNKNRLNVEIFGDPSGKSLSTKSYLSDYDIIKEVVSKYTYLYRFNILKSHPSVRDRINVVNNLFYKQKLLVKDNCKFLIRDLENVCYDNNMVDIDKSNLELTHLSDALGYFAFTKSPIFSRIESYVGG